MKKIMIIILAVVLIGAGAAGGIYFYKDAHISARAVILEKRTAKTPAYKNEWVSERGKQYYYNDKGEKSRGIEVIDGKTYLFDDKLNYMKKGWAEIGSRKRYFGEDGIMVTGSQKIEDHTYYFDSDGNMAVGWIKRDGQTFYYDENGRQAFGKKQIDGKEYWFDAETGAYQKQAYDPEKPMVALTYDDGPSAKTDKILDILDKNHARATFFQIGNQVSYYPDTEKRIVSMNCELANHTWEHKWLSQLSKKGINYQIDHTNDTVESISGTRPKLMRPPGGFYNDTVRAEADMPMIYWSIDTEDWKTRDADKTIDAVLDHVKDGDIILMHDLYEETVEASETIIPELIKKGYQLVTVSELAQARGVQMENGEVYYSFYQ